MMTSPMKKAVTVQVDYVNVLTTYMCKHTHYITCTDNVTLFAITNGMVMYADVCAGARPAGTAPPEWSEDTHEDHR